MQAPLEISARVLDRSSFGLNTAHDLWQSSLSLPPAQRDLLQSLSTRITACNDHENIAVIRQPGATHVTRLWRCGSKLCSDCLSRQSLKSRRLLTNAVAAQKLRPGERYYFATFTIKNPHLSLLETRSIVARAWTLFRKRSVCVALIRGGSKSEEFTVTPNGFHYHLHCMFLSKFLFFSEIRRTWTDCVRIAFAEHDRELEVATSDGLLWVVIKQVVPNDACIRELCKYVTKSDSWTKLPTSSLVEIAQVRRWNRMFELFGSFRTTQPREPIVHTESLSDGEHRASHSYWRDIVDRHGFLYYEIHLDEQLDQCRKRRLRSLQQQFGISHVALLSNIES